MTALGPKASLGQILTLLQDVHSSSCVCVCLEGKVGNSVEAAKSLKRVPTRLQAQWHEGNRRESHSKGL